MRPSGNQLVCASRPGPRDSRGAAMIETAIALPVILMLTFAAIEFGFVLYRHVVLHSTAAEVARIVAICPNTDPSCQPGAAAVQARGKELLAFTAMNPDDFAIVVTDGGESILVTVTLNTRYTLAIPFIPPVVLPLQASSRMRKEGPPP